MKIADESLQPETFAFSSENLEKAKGLIARYPDGRQASALIPLLDLAQRQHQGWLPRAAMEAVAQLLSMPFMRVLEVATFYTMFNLQPVGKHFVQVCTTTPCWLRGSDELVKVCKDHLGIRKGETTEDGQFTLAEVECLGACANAPMVQINDDYYEDLDAASFEAVLDALGGGAVLKPGSVKGRRSSEPVEVDTKPYVLEVVNLAALSKSSGGGSEAKTTSRSKRKVIPLPQKEGD
ncbi:MAG: NADH-quinone oxidoreductase subunit NuoE [Alphaproteobacteria bacterium]